MLAIIILKNMKPKTLIRLIGKAPEWGTSKEVERDNEWLFIIDYMKQMGQ